MRQPLFVTLYFLPLIFNNVLMASCFSGGKARFQHRLIHLWNVVVRVIRPRGKVRTDVRQIRTQLFNAAGKCAVVSRLRRFHRFAPLRGDDLHDSFRLRKVHFAV